MNIAEIEASLRLGLHDALLEALEVNWVAATAVLSVRVMMSDRPNDDRRAKVTVTGLAFLSMDPPDPGRRESPGTERGLWIGAGEGLAHDGHRDRLPRVEPGCFLHWFFVNQWNSFIYISGREAHLEWVEPSE